jgi:hypothetical protein
LLFVNAVVIRSYCNTGLGLERKRLPNHRYD